MVQFLLWIKFIKKNENFSFEMDLEKQVEIGITYVLQLYSSTMTLQQPLMLRL
jgi:hypothetical protein